MPRQKLTSRSVAYLKPRDGKRTEYFDTSLAGFSVRVTPSGRKSFSVLYRRGRQLRRYTLGSFPVLNLSQARNMARKALAEVTMGGDPAARKAKDRRAPTMTELAATYLDRHARPNKKTWREDERSLERNILPELGPRLAEDITRREIAALLAQIVARPAPVEANRTLALLRTLYNWAISQDLVARSPCEGLRRPARERRRDHVLSIDDIRAFWKSLDDEPPLVSGLLRLLFLTAQRGGEVKNLAWDHLELQTAWWTLPGQHTKNGLSHRVPLSPWALDVLRDVHRSSGHSPWVFPAPKGSEPLKSLQGILGRVRRRAGIHFRGHDLRRTAASFMASMGVNRVVLARILNHAERSVTSIYDRYSYDREKRQALDAWAERLKEIVSENRQERITWKAGD